MSPKAVRVPPADPAYRLQKADLDYLVQALRDRGLVVHTKKDVRIDAYDPVTRAHACGFSWHKATSTTPGRWSFDFTMADVFALRDLKTVLGEVQRVQRLRPEAQRTWDEYQDTKSEKRWAQYQGVMAALFAFRTPPKEPDPNG